MFRRAPILAALFWLALAGAAQAQGNGPGFHAAVFFDGACSAAFNQVVSTATPPAAAGPTVATCLNGTSAAAGEASERGVRASTHQGGPGARSIGRARIQIDNVVITGPAAASIPVSMNVRMRGSLRVQEDFGSAGVFLYLALGGGLLSTSAIDMIPTGYLNQTGLFAPLEPGFPSAAIDQYLSTPPGTVVPNQPVQLDLELMTYSGQPGSNPTHSDFFTGQSGVALPFGIPVFNLPPGYTVDIPELNVFNNFVVLPAVLDGDFIVVGSSASEISAPGLMQVTGAVNIDGNTAATGIDLSSLDSVGGTISVDGNTAATGIDLRELDTVGGAVSIDGNTAATGVDLSSLDSVGGTISVDGNTAATGVDLSELDTVGGAVNVTANTAATGIDLSSLDFVGGTVNVAGNTAATGIDLRELDTVGGAVDVSGNTSATGVDLAALQSVDGDLTANDNGTCTNVILGALTTVAGDLTIQSCGTGVFSIGSVAVDGDTSLDTTGYSTVNGTTAAGATTVSNATADARITVHLPSGSFTAPTTFALTRVDPQTLVPETGTTPEGAATIDPIAAYAITFGVPVLNADATLTFDVFLAGLDGATAAALLEALASGEATLVTRGDAAGSEYQAFALCGDAEPPSAGGCVQVQLLDASGQPTTEAPAIVRFTGVAGHFSTWGVAVVTPVTSASFTFAGLLAPYPAPPYDETPTFVRGRVIPLKFAWTGGAGGFVDSAAAAPSVSIYPLNCASLAPSSEPITPEEAGKSGGLRYDAATAT